MWLFVFFDLPTETKTDKRKAQGFRKELLRDGFTMMQFSVYTRHCASWQSGQVHIKRVKSKIPSKGHVSIVQITDKQYGDILNFIGKRKDSLAQPSPQLELF